MQEPEALEPGAGAGQQNVTELDAWLKCSALSALGMPVQEVSCQRETCKCMISACAPEMQTQLASFVMLIKMQHSASQRSTAQQSTAQHGTAQHSTAQHSHDTHARCLLSNLHCLSLSTFSMNIVNW